MIVPSNLDRQSAAVRKSRSTVGNALQLVCGATLAAAPIALSASPAMAAGLWVNEMGTPDLGTAAAGRAALAEDAATVFGNPAGMTSLQARSCWSAPSWSTATSSSTAAPARRSAAATAANASGLIPGGSLFYAQNVTPDVSLGFWSGSYFAGGVQYDDGWSGRYYGTKAELITLGAGINAAYRVNDWLSIGGGPLVLYGTLEQKAAINNVLDGGQDGSYEFDDDELGFGGMAGILLEPRAGTRIGVTYISPVELDFKDRLSTNNLGPVLQGLKDAGVILDGHIDLGITVPQQVMVSAYHRLNDRLSIMGNLVWQDWSAFGKPDVSAASVTNETFDLDYDDTFGFALGLQFAFAERWLWSAGGGFETSPMSKGERSPNLPLDQQFRHRDRHPVQLGPQITVGAAYEYLNGGDAELDVERGPLAGRSRATTTPSTSTSSPST